MADYKYWNEALSDPGKLKRKELRITSDPQPGFYRDKGGMAVAIWEENGELVVMRGDMPIDPRGHEQVWLSCAMRPVTEAWYEHVMAGEPWPDVDAALARRGDNIRAGMDEVEQIELLNDEVGKYGQIEDDNTAARAISLRARLMELKGIVDKKREALKAPHLKECRQIDLVWMPPVKLATQAANALSGLVSAWETTKRRRIREAEEVMERLRREAEVQGGPPPPSPPAATPEPKDQIKAGYGRAASVREKLVVTGVDNLDQAFASVGMRESVEMAMVKEAQKVIDAGATSVPGFVIELQALIR